MTEDRKDTIVVSIVFVIFALAFLGLICVLTWALS